MDICFEGCFFSIDQMVAGFKKKRFHKPPLHQAFRSNMPLGQQKSIWAKWDNVKADIQKFRESLCFIEDSRIAILEVQV